jgi:two-component system, cell cycle sensor histidine kinase PleC
MSDAAIDTIATDDALAQQAMARVTERFVGRAHRHTRRVCNKIIIAAVALIVLMWVFIGASLWSERETALARGRLDGRNLAAAFAEDITHTFDTISRVLDLIATKAVSEPDGLSRASLERWARDLPALARQGAHVSIVGADGRMIFSTFRPDPGPVDLSQTPHVRVHLENPDHGLWIGPAIAGQISRDPLIHVSRRLTGPDGRFAGVAMFMIAPAQLTSLHQTVDLGPRGAIAIIGTDGIVRARFSQDHPDGLLGLGGNVRSGPFPDNLKPGQSASYIRVGVLDPIERLFSVRRLEAYPLIVNVALDMDDVLRQARIHAWLLTLIGIVFTGLISGLTALLIREIWRRTGREVELEIEREQLRLAQDQISIDRVELATANRELIASKEHAEAANRAKSQFLANMSHELRTPLHAILGFSELIQQQAARSESRLVEYAGDILSSGRHLLDLINAILDISKVESGTERLNETTVAISDIVRSSLVAVRSQAERMQISLEQRIRNDLPRIRADNTRMRQVMINLLSNAVKFTPGDGRVIVSADRTPDGGVVVAVSDTGIGMSEPEIAVALQPFGQVDNTFKRPFQGTGLGLPLAARLVELHGGQLVVTSTKGAGTTVEVRLPPSRVLEPAPAGSPA